MLGASFGRGRQAPFQVMYRAANKLKWDAVVLDEFGRPVATKF